MLRDFNVESLIKILKYGTYTCKGSDLKYSTWPESKHTYDGTPHDSRFQRSQKTLKKKKKKKKTKKKRRKKKDTQINADGPFVLLSHSYEVTCFR